jgi:hypothetical protein
MTVFFVVRAITWALSRPTPMAQIQKSFLRRFFSKKRLLIPVIAASDSLGIPKQLGF